MVTQMCFDMPVLVKWLSEMRDRGITTPVWIGLPGVMDRMRLSRHRFALVWASRPSTPRSKKVLSGCSFEARRTSLTRYSKS